MPVLYVFGLFQKTLTTARLFSRQNKVNDGEEGASGITASPDCQSGKRWIYAFISAMSLISESKRVTFSRETLCFPGSANIFEIMMANNRDLLWE